MISIKREKKIPKCKLPNLFDPQRHKIVQQKLNKKFNEKDDYILPGHFFGINISFLLMPHAVRKT